MVAFMCDQQQKMNLNKNKETESIHDAMKKLIEKKKLDQKAYHICYKLIDNNLTLIINFHKKTTTSFYISF